jgi:hypothetical protein
LGQSTSETKLKIARLVGLDVHWCLTLARSICGADEASADFLPGDRVEKKVFSVTLSCMFNSSLEFAGLRASADLSGYRFRLFVVDESSLSDSQNLNSEAPQAKSHHPSFHFRLPDVLRREQQH